MNKKYLLKIGGFVLVSSILTGTAVLLINNTQTQSTVLNNKTAFRAATKTLPADTTVTFPTDVDKISVQKISEATYIPVLTVDQIVLTIEPNGVVIPKTEYTLEITQWNTTKDANTIELNITPKNTAIVSFKKIFTATEFGISNTNAFILSQRVSNATKLQLASTVVDLGSLALKPYYLLSDKSEIKINKMIPNDDKGEILINYDVIGIDSNSSSFTSYKNFNFLLKGFTSNATSTHIIANPDMTIADKLLLTENIAQAATQNIAGSLASFGLISTTGNPSTNTLNEANFTRFFQIKNNSSSSSSNSTSIALTQVQVPELPFGFDNIKGEAWVNITITNPIINATNPVQGSSSLIRKVILSGFNKVAPTVFTSNNNTVVTFDGKIGTNSQTDTRAINIQPSTISSLTEAKDVRGSIFNFNSSTIYPNLLTSAVFSQLGTTTYADNSGKLSLFSSKYHNYYDSKGEYSSLKDILEDSIPVQDIITLDGFKSTGTPQIQLVTTLIGDPLKTAELSLNSALANLASNFTLVDSTGVGISTTKIKNWIGVDGVYNKTAKTLSKNVFNANVSVLVPETKPADGIKNVYITKAVANNITGIISIQYFIFDNFGNIQPSSLSISGYKPIGSTIFNFDSFKIGNETTETYYLEGKTTTSVANLDNATAKTFLLKLLNNAVNKKTISQNEFLPEDVVVITSNGNKETGTITIKFNGLKGIYKDGHLTEQTIVKTIKIAGFQSEQNYWLPSSNNFKLKAASDITTSELPTLMTRVHGSLATNQETYAYKLISTNNTTGTLNLNIMTTSTVNFARTVKSENITLIGFQEIDEQTNIMYIGNQETLQLTPTDKTKLASKITNASYKSQLETLLSIAPNNQTQSIIDQIAKFSVNIIPEFANDQLGIIYAEVAIINGFVKDNVSNKFIRQATPEYKLIGIKTDATKATSAIADKIIIRQEVVNTFASINEIIVRDSITGAVDFTASNKILKDITFISNNNKIAIGSVLNDKYFGVVATEAAEIADLSISNKVTNGSELYIDSVTGTATLEAHIKNQFNPGQISVGTFKVSFASTNGLNPLATTKATFNSPALVDIALSHWTNLLPNVGNNQANQTKLNGIIYDFLTQPQIDNAGTTSNAAVEFIDGYDYKDQNGQVLIDANHKAEITTIDKSSFIVNSINPSQGLVNITYKLNNFITAGLLTQATLSAPITENIFGFEIENMPATIQATTNESWYTQTLAQKQLLQNTYSFDISSTNILDFITLNPNAIPYGLLNNLEITVNPNLTLGKESNQLNLSINLPRVYGVDTTTNKIVLQDTTSTGINGTFTQSSELLYTKSFTPKLSSTATDIEVKNAVVGSFEGNAQNSINVLDLNTNNIATFFNLNKMGALDTSLITMEIKDNAISYDTVDDGRVQTPKLAITVSLSEYITLDVTTNQIVKKSFQNLEVILGGQTNDILEIRTNQIGNDKNINNGLILSNGLSYSLNLSSAVFSYVTLNDLSDGNIFDYLQQVNGGIYNSIKISDFFDISTSLIKDYDTEIIRFNMVYNNKNQSLFNFTNSNNNNLIKGDTVTVTLTGFAYSVPGLPSWTIAIIALSSILSIILVALLIYVLIRKFRIKTKVEDTK